MPTSLPHRRRRAKLGAAGILILLAGVVTAYVLTHRGPRAIGGATQADVQWRIPRQAIEERPFVLRIDGGVDGHAAIRTALQAGSTAAACPAVPPDDSSRQVLVDRPDPEQRLDRSIGHSETFTAAASGPVRLCGWLVATSPAGDGRVVARFDRALRIEPAPAMLEVSQRTRVRAGARFKLRTTSATSGAGRRLLLLAVPVETPANPRTSGAIEAGDDDRCRALRPARRSPQRPVRLEAPLPSGDSDSALRARFPFLAVGDWVLCTQIREADDPEPEAVHTQRLVVRESRECVAAKAAIGERRDDLRTIRRRREVLERRVSAARRELRAASSDGRSAARRKREAANDARLRSYEVGTKAMSQLIDRVTSGARTYCPDL